VKSNIRYPHNPFRIGTQNYRVYEALITQGRITTNDLIHKMHIVRGAARVWDINNFLKPYLLAVKCKAVQDKRGVFEYSL